jgi:hypothetical protein
MTVRDAPFRRWEGALFRVVGTNVLLARPARSGIDLLSGSAGMLWQILEAPMKREDVVAALADLYGVASAAIERDVWTLLEDLKRRGWVEQDLGGNG